MGSSLLMTMVAVSMVRCPVWRDISPCHCKIINSTVPYMTVMCMKMDSFGQVVDKLKGHFTPQNRVHLTIEDSNLTDLDQATFKELNTTIDQLYLNRDKIRLPLPEKPFKGLMNRMLTLTDSTLEEVPRHLWKVMINIRTLDLSRNKITSLSTSDFAELPDLETLSVAGNLISRMDSDCIPRHIRRLHLGRNVIRDLNNTLVELSDLQFFFINQNKLTDIDNQLPNTAPKLVMIHGGDNQITRIPQQLKVFQNYPKLDNFFFFQNKLGSLDGALGKSRRLSRVVLEHNDISTLTEADFEENETLENLLLGYNKLTNLNNSLVNLRNLKCLNVTCNLLMEFSFQEIVGLKKLYNVDLSFNRIEILKGPGANLLEWDINLEILKLDNNLLEYLNGSLAGLSKLKSLNLNKNKLKMISPDDLLGLESLQNLDLSYNQLTTLEEMSKSYLPKLSVLKASYNYLTILEKDFHGLPVLCEADFEHNQISAIGRELVDKTRCQIGQYVWDTLKINLQENPILCVAAFPEINSAMEINHARIFGLSHCPPLSEEPITSEPSPFFGFKPTTTTEPTTLPTTEKPTTIQSISASIKSILKLSEPENLEQPITAPPTLESRAVPAENTNLPEVPPTLQVSQILHKQTEEEQRRNEEYTVVNAPQNSNNLTEINVVEKQEPTVALIPQADMVPDTSETPTIPQPILDLSEQKLVISELVSQLKILESKVDHLSSQNDLLLHQQLNQSILIDPAKLPKPIYEETRLP